MLRHNPPCGRPTWSIGPLRMTSLPRVHQEPSAPMWWAVMRYLSWTYTSGAGSLVDDYVPAHGHIDTLVASAAGAVPRARVRAPCHPQCLSHLRRRGCDERRGCHEHRTGGDRLAVHGFPPRQRQPVRPARLVQARTAGVSSGKPIRLLGSEPAGIGTSDHENELSPPTGVRPVWGCDVGPRLWVTCRSTGMAVLDGPPRLRVR